MADDKIKPSRWWYAVAGGIALCGMGLYSGLMVLIVTGMLKPPPWQTIVPGRYEMNLPEAGEYVIFHEPHAVVNGRVFATQDELGGLVFSLTCRQTGAKVPLATYQGGYTYTVGSRSGRAILDFTVGAPGRYVLSGEYPEGVTGGQAVVAVGRPFAWRPLLWMFGSCFVLVAILAAAGAIALVTLSRRKKAKRGLLGYPGGASSAPPPRPPAPPPPPPGIRQR
jgi:hypothetical protein